MVRINQVVQVGGSGELGGPDGQGGQDNQPTCYAMRKYTVFMV